MKYYFQHSFPKTCNEMFKDVLYTGDERLKQIVAKDVKLQANHYQLIPT